MTAAEQLAAILRQQPEPITPVAPTAPPGLLDVARQWAERRGQGLLEWGQQWPHGEGLLGKPMVGQMMDAQLPADWRDRPAESLLDPATMNVAQGLAFGLGVLPMGSIGGRTGIPNTPPAGLRERYDSLLYQASGGKDPSRIKLTPERVEAAKGLLEQQMRNRQGFLGDQPYRQTTQMQQAISFAEQAKRAGHDVALKTPDGPFGSIYVRVGDKGTVRFADHAQPTTPAGEPTGGYSKTLGRRHYPATLSVSRGDSTFDDALRWLGD